MNLLFTLAMVAGNLIPSEDEVKAASQKVVELGKKELFEMPLLDIAEFVWDFYIRGPDSEFHYYGCNPREIKAEEAGLPATILLHAYESNQGEWIPLLESLRALKKKGEAVGPVFTFNYPNKQGLKALTEKIAEVKQLYKEAGVDLVELNLIGHSLGGIVAAEYAYQPQIWVPDTQVIKVIAVASRLRNIDPITETPYYPFCYGLLDRVEEIWQLIQENQDLVPLYTMAAENDWLVPAASVLIGKNQATIPDTGHALINRNPVAVEQVIEWLMY